MMLRPKNMSVQQCNLQNELFVYKLLGDTSRLIELAAEVRMAGQPQAQLSYTGAAISETQCGGAYMSKAVDAL